MSTKIIIAVLACAMTQTDKVFKLCKAIILGLYAYPLLFPNPLHTQAEFKDQYTKVKDLWDQVLSGREDLRSDYEAQMLILWNMIGDLLFYTNMLFRGQPDNITKSGFAKSAEPVTNAIPGQLVIKSVQNGKEEHSAKIYLVKGCGYGPNVNGRLKYILQMAEGSPVEENFKSVLETTNRFDIVKKNLTRGKEVHFRIAAWNSAGRGLWSDVVPFIPQ
jgi:hypothetical protein